MKRKSLYLPDACALSINKTDAKSNKAHLPKSNKAIDKKNLKINAMKKTDKKIFSFLSLCQYRSETIWSSIAAICKQSDDYNHMNIPAPKKGYDPVAGLTCDQFIEWLSSGFAKGDVVAWNGTVALLGDTDLTSSVVTAYIEDDKLVHDIKISIKLDEVSQCSPEQFANFKQLIISDGFEVSPNYLILAEKKIPRNLELVKFYNDTITGYGAVREVKDGVVTMFCYYTTGKQVYYSMHGVLGRVEDFQFEPLSLHMRKKLDNELGKVGKRWNEHRHRIEPIDLRVSQGKVYWFIDDRFRVWKEVEKITAKTNSKYLNGNYFRTEEEAAKFLKLIVELRNNMMAK